MRLARFGVFAALAVSAGVLHAESKNIADYPLRIHVFGRSETTFYRWENVDNAKGEGRANLFENGDARGVDFSFDCSEKLRASFGFETYPARWKKPGRDLLVLLPVFGQTGKYFTCDLKTDVKDFAYTKHDGRMGEEPVAAFRTWMVKHDYDPEHGKDMPVKTAAPEQGAEGGGAAAGQH